MLRGLYTAAAGMISQQRKHDTITNNISNMNTPGFKAGTAVSRSFPEMLIAAQVGDADQPLRTVIGRMNTGVFAEEDLSIYLQGDLEETKNPLDFALVSNIEVPGMTFDGSGKYVSPDGQVTFQPQAFFTVQNQNGETRYSRNGRFTANIDGELITPEGYKVIGQDGQPIVLRDEATGTYIPSVKVTPEGRLVDAVNGLPLLDANGTQLQLLLSRVENPHRLIREGNGVYRLEAGEEANVTTVVPNGQVVVQQGYIERSNVDPTQSMIDINAAMRAYEANQKIVQYYDRSLEKAVNEVGRV
jgi:flagellar basal-body rod protein FlgG